ncbi:tetratricopeptide repeat protein [Hyphobacterium sp. HN65]|uniref:Tetratricopeptide repeat protein n=1 Tax=Hyphobacterium lacteum TaxID=3116575 RepID=A0ABU7LLE7_9PROT|nr:tetratricopeptide repeat protein [Hyphobacterium sp. HN65]MEE2524753.1 tetratricopeptide repeat protein [Hyphobacterium sp. HN65]
MADIFHEVEEELRKDKYNELLRSWGPWALGAAVAIVLGAAGWQGWEYLERQSRWEESDRYFAALDLIADDQLLEADLELQRLTEEGSPGYAGLALMQRGELLLQSGDNESAGYMFEQAAEAFTFQAFADLARVKAAMALFDILSIDDLQNRLGETMQPERPYRLLAMEVIAAKAFAIGDYARAESEYDAIANDLDALTLPVAQRAQIALDLIRRIRATEGDTAEMPAEESAAETSSGAGDAPAEAGDEPMQFNLNMGDAADEDAANGLNVDSPALPDAAGLLNTETEDDGQD